MSEIIENSVFDDELLNIIVPDDEENDKKSKKTRTKRFEKHLERS